MSKFKFELMRIMNCETGVECPADSDDPCAECRTEQTINLITSNLPDMGEEEIFDALVQYSMELCTSNPIQKYNHTEAVRRTIKAYQSKLKKELEGVINEH